MIDMFSKTELQAIGWTGAREIYKPCPKCGHENLIKLKDILDQKSLLCKNCGIPVQLRHECGSKNEAINTKSKLWKE